MNLIAAADKRWAIGRDGDLLLRIPEDLKEFAKRTTGHVIVMGRKTLESFPEGKPLKNRTNIVLSGNPSFDGKGALVVHGKKELFETLRGYEDNEIYVAGGESIYRLLLPYCKKAYITRIIYEFMADTWMPDLDQMPGWVRISQGEDQISQGKYHYRFDVYENKRPKKY